MKRAWAAVLLGAVALAGCAGSGRQPQVSVRPGGQITPVGQVRGDGAAADIRLTRHVPCPGNHPRVGPARLSRLRAVTAVMCEDGFRVYPGQGQWEVFVRKVAVSGVAASQRYFEQPDKPNWPKNGICTANLEIVIPIAFVDARGRWLVPKTPVDRCDHPLGLPPGETKPPKPVKWRVVSVRRIRQQISAPALAAHCPMEWGNSVAWAGPPRDSTGGPLFSVAPKTVRICVFRTSPSHFALGHFVRGFRLDASRTRRLLRALTGAGPRRGCAKQRSFAVLSASPGSGASVELGGCYRVDRPDRLAGTANPAVARAILGGP